jgi:hypothetical protein
MKNSDNMNNRTVPIGKCLWQIIALTMSMVMLYSVLLITFHYHDDGQDHDDDCPICAVAHHHTADITITLPDAAYLPFSFPAYFAALVPTIAVIRFCHSPQNRAPPV